VWAVPSPTSNYASPAVTPPRCLHGARTECRPDDRQRPGLGLQLRGLAIADEAQGFVGRPCLYDGVMAYDEHLADRIRELLVGESGVTEKKMFGGLAFLVRGNMAVAASGQGGVLVRVDPAASDRLVARTNARRMEMRGRAMRGWLRVESDAVRTKRQLARWVGLGTTYARSLRAKR
jgi:TfoX/Sxy family transcriptional regulator of competence genes